MKRNSDQPCETSAFAAHDKSNNNKEQTNKNDEISSSNTTEKEEEQNAIQINTPKPTLLAIIEHGTCMKQL